MNREDYPRTSKYDPEWLRANMMGPNAAMLLERLSGHMQFVEGMRVLDLGCGRGITPVFLAKEFGVQVWATDLWISATDNYNRFKEAGLDNQIFPIHADAHELPYADEFFDAAVSIDAYHYFGTEENYIDKYLAKLVKPGGQIGIVVPGLSRELYDDEIPEGLEDYWEDDFSTFHCTDWWKEHWSKSRFLELEYAENMPDGKTIWYESIWRQGEHGSDFDREFLRADKNNIMTMVMMVGRKSSI